MPSPRGGWELPVLPNLPVALTNTEPEPEEKISQGSSSIGGGDAHKAPNTPSCGSHHSRHVPGQSLGLLPHHLPPQGAANRRVASTSGVSQILSILHKRAVVCRWDKGSEWAAGFRTTCSRQSSAMAFLPRALVAASPHLHLPFQTGQRRPLKPARLPTQTKHPPSLPPASPQSVPTRLSTLDSRLPFSSQRPPTTSHPNRLTPNRHL